MSDERKKWAELFRRLRYRVLAEASASALRVFVALESWAGGDDGYAYPSIAAIQEKTGIKKADTVSEALSEMESLGIIYHRRLGSYTKGFIAPNLYRIGFAIVDVPERARKLFYLIAESPRPERVGREQYPEKRGNGPKKPSKDAANNSSQTRRGGSVPPKNGVTRTPVCRGNALPPKRGVELNEVELIEGGSPSASPPLVSWVGERARFSTNTPHPARAPSPGPNCVSDLKEDEPKKTEPKPVLSPDIDSDARMSEAAEAIVDLLQFENNYLAYEPALAKALRYLRRTGAFQKPTTCANFEKRLDRLRVKKIAADKKQAECDRRRERKREKNAAKKQAAKLRTPEQASNGRYVN